VLARSVSDGRTFDKPVAHGGLSKKGKTFFKFVKMRASVACLGLSATCNVIYRFAMVVIKWLWVEILPPSNNLVSHL
jgi:hypothetical protein